MKFILCLLAGEPPVAPSPGLTNGASARGKPAQEIAHAAQAWGQNDDITVRRTL